MSNPEEATSGGGHVPVSVRHEPVREDSSGLVLHPRCVAVLMPGLAGGVDVEVVALDRVSAAFASVHGFVLPDDRTPYWGLYPQRYRIPVKTGGLCSGEPVTYPVGKHYDREGSPMSEYTSGTQALRGRKINHDPEPWVDLAHGNRHPDTDIGGIAVWYDPRPEFDVLDNPILIELRQYAHATDLTRAVATLRDWWVPGGSAIPAAREQADHAWRVLRRLDALLRDCPA